MGGEVPHPVMVEGGIHPVMVGGIPHPVWWGVPHSVVVGVPNPVMVGVPHPVMVGGTPGYPPPIQTWDWVPLRPGMGYPPDLEQGTPYPSRPGMGYPQPRPVMGYPPHPDLGQGTLPPPMVNRQTFPSINITFSHTTYAGGNEVRKPKSLSPDSRDRVFCLFAVIFLCITLQNNMSSL